MQQTILPFKLEVTSDELTSHAGLAIFGEWLSGLGFSGLVDAHVPGPGSAIGYRPSQHAMPLVLMLCGGGRSLEDMRILRSDSGLLRLLEVDAIPSSDALGDWLKRQGDGKGLAGLGRVRRNLLRRILNNEERCNYTLDIDATQIVAEKREAQHTYKGEKGYMPMVGHLAENGLVVLDEFRHGNTAPAARNLEFIQACEKELPKGKRITAIRADSAAYQAGIINWCAKTGKVFAIGADQDAAVKAAIKMIPESEWVSFRDGEISETVHCMNKTKQAFRLIVLRRPQQADLLDKTITPYRYHAIASNRENENSAATMEWYSKRGDTSENRIKDVKIGFGMERMPCGSFAANAVFFRLGIIAYNLYIGFRSLCGSQYAKSQVQTIRWRIFNTAGKIVRHAGQVFLKVAAELRTVFAEMRQRCCEFCTEAIAA